MKIYDALKKDHREVLVLLDRLIALSDEDDTRFKLADDIRDALIPHSRAEEAVFYNSIRALDADSGKVLHGYAEHLGAERLLRTLLVKEKVKLDWRATARKLKDALSHHIHEEETEIFALAQKVLTDEDAEKIGLAFERMKPEIKKEGMMKTTLEMVQNLMPPKISKVSDLIDRRS
jgi:hemerythrin-like domain-containing protein